MMKLLKELGLVLLGMLIAGNAIFAYAVHVRLVRNEQTIAQVVQFLQRSAPAPAVEEKKK